MRTFLTLSAILILIFAWSPSSAGKPVDQDAVMRLGENYLEAGWQFRTGGIYASQSESSGMARVKRSISAIRELRDGGRLLAYILDLEPQGCIIVSTDTDIYPVIAYSDAGRFSMVDDPENIFLHLVRWDMQNRFNALPITSQSLVTENNYLWSEYLAEEGRFTTLAASSGSWGPWLKTQWSQGWANREPGFVYPDYDYSDYNRYCPLGHNSEWRSLTGCGPTSMAQLLNYWKYPSSISLDGSDDYTSSSMPYFIDGQSHTLTLDIDDDYNTYDFPRFSELNSRLSSIRYYDGDLYFWDVGLWNYRSPVDEDPGLNAAAKQEIKEDIAALLFACGIVMEVDYSPSYTSYSSSYIPGIASDYPLLTDTFGYSSASTADIGWAPFYATLEQNMKDEQPALLFIDSQSRTQGHILVADGYRDEWQGGSQGYYHLNFGWGNANPDSVSDSWYHLPEGMPQPEGLLNYSVVKLGIVDILPPEQGDPPQQNTPPVASNLNISPSLPKTANNLVASYSYDDADGDPENGSEIRWYKNGVIQSAHNNNLTVSSSNTSKGETWYFTVRPNDGNAFGSTVTSPGVTIGNTVPIAEASGPYTGETGEIVTFHGSGSFDADGDLPLTYTWNFGDGNGDTTQNATTTHAYAAAGTYTVTLTVSDGSNSSIPDQTNAVITAPIVIDIGVSKEVNNATPNAGDTVTYTITATNNGPDDATGVEITDILPQGLGYISNSPSRGSYDNVTGRWTIGNLTNSASVTLIITATVGAVAGGIINTASVTDVDQEDTNSGNNSASADIIAQYADLAINKSVNDPTPNEGDTVTYTVAVTNNGPVTATSVEITDQLPSGVEYLSATTTQGSLMYVSAANKVVFTVGTLINGASVTLNIIAIVDTGTCGVPITNTASITATDQVDPNNSNNSNSVDITVQCADLEVSKSVDEPNPGKGDTVKYTVTVTNNGPDSATNVKLTDELPSGVTYKSATITQGNYNSITGIWTVGGLNNGVSAILTISAIVDTDACSVAVINTASIASVDQADPDNRNNSDSAELTVQCADLEVSKSVNDPTPGEGETIIYTITVTNNGPDDATGVEITDRLPSGVIYSSARPTRGSITYMSTAISRDSQNKVIWTVGNLLNGANATITITGRIDAGACAETLTNTASITAVDQEDPDVNNNSDSADVTVKCVDLAIDKSVDDSSPNEGDTIVYTITVTNNEAEPATNVKITDQLPSGITYVSDDANGKYNSNTGMWTVGSLSGGASATLNITATVDSGSCAETIINMASITAVDQADPNISNNIDSAGITVQCADLRVNKTVDNNSPNEGDAITYTITVANNGPDAATNVEVIDVLPSGVAYTTATATQGNYNSVTGVWTVGNLNNGASAMIYIMAKVSKGVVNKSTCGVPITNSASITAVDQADSDTSNNSDSADITLQCADLKVDKTVDNEAPDVGDTITYTVTVSNDGANTATNVEITDILPIGVTYTSATMTQGKLAYVSAAASRDDYSKIIWTVGSLADGASATITIRATVDENTCGIPITNIASITTADQIDPDMSNNSDSADVAVQCADLEVSKTVDNPTPDEGDAVTYTVTVTNHGPDSATNVQITDLMPSGVTYVSDDARGSYNNIRGLWSLRSLSNGSSAVLNITAKVDKGMVDEDNIGVSITNTASVTTVDQADPDSSNDNDSADITVQYVDLEMGMSVDDDTPNEGDTIAYTITVTNSGPDAATNVVITDQLPSGITYLSDDAGGGYNSITGTWAVNRLSDGAGAALKITATVDAGFSGLTITNSASVTSVDQTDTDITNNVSSVSLTSVKMQLVSASYQVMESLLTMVFNDPIDPDRTHFDKIGIEIANSIIPGFSLSDCPGIEAGTPYEDNGITLYPITIDMQCDASSVLGLATPAFVTSLSDDINLVLEPDAFTHPDGGQSPAASVNLNIAVDGLNLRTQGDVSGEGKVTAHDASLILQYIVYGESALPIYDTVAELVGWLEELGQDADVLNIIEYLANTDNRPGITAYDAVMALQFAAGLIDSFCASCAPAAEMTRRNGRLMASKYNDGRLAVSIDLDDASDVYSADMMVTYDPQILTLTDVSGTAATSEWLSEHRITAPGKLRISMAGAHQPSSDGSLATLSFDAVSADAIRSLNLSEFKLNGGRLRTEIHNLPRTFALLQNYPNPFNPETWIPYRLSEPANVTVTIYNMTGQVVRRLEFGNRMPGSYVDRSKAVHWDGKNQQGEKVSSGIYFYKLQAGREASVGKMTIAQ